MVFANKWIPTAGNRKEEELRRLKDKKNHRERVRKNKKQEQANRLPQENLPQASPPVQQDVNAVTGGAQQSTQNAPEPAEGHDDKPLCIFLIYIYTTVSCVYKQHYDYCFSMYI